MRWSITTDSRITDDLIATRENDGTVDVRISGWVRPAQRLVLLALLADVLDREPRTALALRMSAGAALTHAPELAGVHELVDLMDRRELTSEQRSRAVELVCLSR